MEAEALLGRRIDPDPPAFLSEAEREELLAGDPRNHQTGGDHYRSMKIQPIDFIQANGLGFCEGNVVKYVCRYPTKNGLEDLLKARHYIDLLIRFVEEDRRA